MTDDVQTTPTSTTTTPAGGNDAATVTAAPGAAQTTSPATGGDTPAEKSTATGDFPADWQAKIAAGDEKLAKLVGRYTSPVAIARALQEAQAKLSSGKLREALPKDATPEQLAEYRKSNGIPETPDKYDLTLAEGMKLGEADMPIAKMLTERMHAVNATPDQVKTAVGLWKEVEAQQITARLEKDQADVQAAQEALRGEWGHDYDKRVNQVQSLLDTMPEDARDLFKNGRMADGTPFFANPRVVAWFAQHAQELNPLGTVVPGEGQSALDTATNELASIEAMMGDRNSAYYKGPRAEKLQERYRMLTSATAAYAGKR